MNLDTIILDLTNENSKGNEYWTLGDAVRGVQIFGGIGSGKTAGSGKALARQFLAKGFGGLVLCAKPEELPNWQKLAAETGRSNDLLVMGKGRDKYFNPLAYENNRESEGGGETFNLVNLFMHIYRMGKIISGDGISGSSERFWDNALKRCMARLIDLLKLAEEEISVSNMYTLLVNALTKDELNELREIRHQSSQDKIYNDLMEMAKSNYYVHCYMKYLHRCVELEQEVNAYEGEMKMTKSAKLEEITKTFKLVESYFEREFANLAERTKTVVVESFLGLAEPFLTGILNKYFANKSTISPEETFNGKIIILDFPVKKYLDAGIYAQGIFKLLWQQAVERRGFEEGKDLPVFLWVDESQLFLTSYDQIYQTTARSSGACTVFLSQNISNYYSAIGGRNPTAKVDSLLANLSTKIFHSNNDAVTNEWAAKTIGKALRIMDNYQVSEEKTSSGGNKQYHFQVMPVSFTVLKSGKNENKTELHFETVITTANRRWSDRKNYIEYTFKTRIKK